MIQVFMGSKKVVCLKAEFSQLWKLPLKNHDCVGEWANILYNLFRSFFFSLFQISSMRTCTMKINCGSLVYISSVVYLDIISTYSRKRLVGRSCIEIQLEVFTAGFF